MTASNPTPDDLRYIAGNLKLEGQISRAEIIMNSAKKLEKYNNLAFDMQTDAKRLSAGFSDKAFSWFLSYARYFATLLDGDK